MTSLVQSIIPEIRTTLSSIYGTRLVKLLLFGSQARGDADSGSDIDLLVVLKDPVNPCEEITRVSEATSRLSLAYDTVISCLFMQEDRYLHENSPLLLNIRREGVVL
jgi:predicted nucleotidyltransferase